ncbi:MAG: hypothetical protein PHH37_14540 [Paludibacter sp.]|nr:hypothetical protein [Paludibacter sp.]
MYLEFNTDSTIVDSIPVGVYTMDDSLNPWTLVPAYVDTDNNPWGTWYFGVTNNDVVNGSATVTSVDGKYHIEYELIDYYGNTISGTYFNTLTYYDMTPYITGSGAPQNIKKSRNSTLIRLNLKPVKTR